MSDTLPRAYGEGQLFAFSGFEGPTDPWNGLIGSALDGECGYWFHVNSETWNDYGLRIAAGCRAGDRDRFKTADLPDFQPRLVLGDVSDTCLAGSLSVRFTMVSDTACRIEFDGAGSGKIPCLDMRSHLPGAAVEAGAERLHLAYRRDAYTVEVRGGRIEPAAAGWRARGLQLEASVSWHPAGQRPSNPGWTADTPRLRDARIAWAAGVPVPEGATDAEQRFLRRCAVSLRTNALAPRGIFCDGYTTPDRWPHRNSYLWDSAMQALGYAAFDMDWACRALAAMWAQTTETGFIHSMLTTEGPGEHFETNAPVLAWTALELAERGAPRDFLESSYHPLSRYVLDALARRGADGLVRWDRFSHGMDNSPRFDAGMPSVYADANIYLANELQALGALAGAIGRDDDVPRWDVECRALSNAINARLWDEKTGWYYDLDTAGKFVRVKTPVGIAALLSSLSAVNGRDLRILERVLDRHTFWRPLPVPTVAADEPTCGTDMWRGPAWPNTSFYAWCALQRQGRHDRALELAVRWLEEQRRWYETTGGLYEFYDAEAVIPPAELPRKRGVGALNDYGWGCALPLVFTQDTPR
jgi:hypothetical protein